MSPSLEQSPGTSTSPGFTGLYHVQVPVRGIEESVRWYTDLLGFRELPGRSERHAFLCVDDDLMLMMWKTSDGSTANFTVDGETFPVLLYRTHDIHGLHDRLKYIGTRITFFQDEGFGWVLKFTDINGNMLGAIQDK